MMRQVVISVLLMMATVSALSSQVKVSGAFLQDTVVIGDEAKFILSVEAPSGVRPVAIPAVFLDSIYSALQTFRANPTDTSSAKQPKLADFELIDLGKWSNANGDELFAGDELNWDVSQVGGKALYENTFTLKFWDPGDNVILLPPVLYIDTDGTQQQQYDGGQAIVNIAPPAGLENVSQDSLKVAPIKAILTEPLNVSDFFLPIAIILGIGLLVGLYFLYRKYASKEEEVIVAPEPEVIIPAHVKALNSLTSLRDQQLWQQGKVKEYQSELTHIIRAYLEDRYDVPALENTTHEIVKSLQSQNLMTGNIESLKRILQVADLVKFAKARPDESVHDTFMNEAVELVNKTKIEVRNDE